MKILRRFAGLFFSCALSLLSCKKDFSCENCKEGNKPPIAHAGTDQTIALPTDSALLDGHASHDPDGAINAWLWTNISGPSFVLIEDSTTAQTLVSNLVQGIYEFALTVTDAGGLLSKDTVVITVTAPTPPTSCTNENRPQVQAQLIPIGKLSKPKAGMAVAAAGSKIVFAGGQAKGCAGNWCEDWGTSRVDIYDTVTQTWSTAELSIRRWGIAAVASGNKIFFAGGESGDGAFDTYYSTVDIYDVSTNTWSVASLSQPRSKIAAAAVGNKVLFAGGEMNRDYNTTTTVDIYDLSANSWSTAHLSEARAHISAVTVGDKVYFAGGHVDNRWYMSPSGKIDIYDNATRSWTVSSLNEPMGFLAGATEADKIYWASGCKVEIKDVNSWYSSIAYLSSPMGMWIDDRNAVVKENKIIFFRNEDNTFDIYDRATNSWSVGVLPSNGTFGFDVLQVNGTIYLAGGSTIPNYFSPSDQVYKLAF